MKNKGIEKIVHVNENEKKLEKQNIDSSNIDKIVKTKAIETDKKGYYIMIKGTVQQKDI